MKQLKLPNHIAIILDGNGRWAKKRGLPRSIGHYYGGLNLVKIAKHANSLGLKQLTVYCFSTENWKRPKEEVEYLMSKPLEMLNDNLEKIKDSGIKIEVAGRNDRIPNELVIGISQLVDITKDNIGLKLVLCIDYGSYNEITTAAQISPKTISENLMVKEPVDLLIRQGGEYRLSNFLIWQSAYSELYFVKKYWPSFKEKDLNRAIKVFNQRTRRFGGLK